MEIHTVTVDNAGRVVIPAAIRKQMGFKEGSELLVRATPEGILELYTRENAVHRAQAFFAKYKKPGKSVVDDFIAERRKEAKAEIGD